MEEREGERDGKKEKGRREREKRREAKGELNQLSKVLRTIPTHLLQWDSLTQHMGYLMEQDCNGCAEPTSQAL